MPAGYERLRDALIRKGKSEDEAKSMAAAIWNKHHKDNPVTNKKHEMSREFDADGPKKRKVLLPALASGVLLGNSALQLRLAKDAAEAGDKWLRRANLGAAGTGVFASGFLAHKAVAELKRKKHEMCAIEENCVLLGIPSSDFDAAEARLLKRLKQLGINSHSSRSLSTQEKLPLSAPLVKNPISPNPNPNATTSGPDSPYLGDILAWLRKKQNPSGPLG
jgi:hypothetical protein